MGEGREKKKTTLTAWSTKGMQLQKRYEGEGTTEQTQVHKKVGYIQTDRGHLLSRRKREESRDGYVNGREEDGNPTRSRRAVAQNANSRKNSWGA